jgi:transketolase
LPLLQGSSIEKAMSGAYEIASTNLTNPWTLVATGSEVSLAVDVQTHLAKSGIGLRVVSMPSMNQFLSLPQTTQLALIPNRSTTMTLEALSTFGWSQIGAYNFGIDTFGQSAPGPVVMAHFGMTADAIAKKVMAILQAKN